MNGAHGRTAGQPWYQRARLLVLAVGGLAAAVLSVVTLVNVVFPDDEADVGIITWAQIVRAQSLNEFAETHPDREVPLTPSAAFPSGPVDLTQPLADRQRLPTTTPPPERRSDATPDAGQPERSPGPTLNPTPTATATSAPEPSPTTRPTTTPDPNETAAPGTTRAPAEDSTLRLVRAAQLWPPPEDYTSEVAEHLRQAGFNFDDERAGDEEPPPWPDSGSLIPVCAYVDLVDRRTGELVSPEDLAEALAGALRKVATSPRGDGQQDLLGWVVAVNVDVQGLEGVPLLLTWSLDGLDPGIADNWAADRIAYRLTANTSHDTGSVEVWVPELASTGRYSVNLRLLLQTNGSVLSRAAVPLNLDPPDAD